VFGVTRDPFIIWTSNMFAIASLRALYGLVATVLAELRFLEKAIAVVLAWIGVKMIIEARAMPARHHMSAFPELQGRARDARDPVHARMSCGATDAPMSSRTAHAV
jgi:predicted tellurium resistance membrane protein TerC